MDVIKSFVGWSTTPNPLTDGKIQVLLPSEMAANPNTMEFGRVLSNNEPTQLDGLEEIDLDGAGGEKNGDNRRIVEITERSWDQSLFAWCSGNCCLSCFCPCMMFGRVQYRTEHPEDPDLVQFSHCCNGACWLYYFTLSCPVGGSLLVQCMGNFQRRHIRHRLNLRGNGCLDCLAHYCCQPCALVQSEEELKNPFNREILMNEKGAQGTIKRQPKRRQELMEYPKEPSKPETSDA